MTKKQIEDRLLQKGYQIKELFDGKIFVVKDGKGKILKNHNQAKQRYL